MSTWIRANDVSDVRCGSKADVHRTRDGIFAPPPRADIRAGSRQVRYGPGGATRRPPTCQTQAARLSRLRDVCILRLTRPLLRERLFRCGVPAYEEELAMKLRGVFI